MSSIGTPEQLLSNFTPKKSNFRQLLRSFRIFEILRLPVQVFLDFSQPELKILEYFLFDKFNLSFNSIFKLCLLCFSWEYLNDSMNRGIKAFRRFIQAPYLAFQSLSLQVTDQLNICGRDGFFQNALTRRFLQVDEFG